MEFSLTVQIEPFLIKYLVTHWTHRDDGDEVSFQKSFRLATLFASAMDFNPKPPSSFGKIQSFHATFAFFGLSSGPDHKNAAQRLSIS